MKMKGKVFLALIAMMIFLLASTCIAKVKAEELYTIAEGTLGFIEEPEVQVYYAVRMPSECKIGDVVPLILELQFQMSEEVIIPYVHLYGFVHGTDFDKEYFDVSRKTLEKGTRLTETFEVKLDGDTFDILFKYDIVVSEEEKQRLAGWYWIRFIPPGVYESKINELMRDYESQMSTLKSQINELENELGSTSLQLDNLKTTNTQLSSQLGDLQKRYDSLERDYKGLERDYDTLKKEYESLQKVPLPFVTTGLQWLTPVLIVTTVILAIATIYFATRKHQSPIK